LFSAITLLVIKHDNGLFFFFLFFKNKKRPLNNKDPISKSFFFFSLVFIFFFPHTSSFPFFLKFFFPFRLLTLVRLIQLRFTSSSFLART